MHVLDSADSVGGLYVIGPPNTLIGRHYLNAIGREILGVLTEGGVTPRASGAVDATASYTGQLKDAIIAIANARFAALHPAAFASEFSDVSNSQWVIELEWAMAHYPALADFVDGRITTLFPGEFAALHPSAFSAAYDARFATDFSDALDAALVWQNLNIQIYDEDNVSLQGSTVCQYKVYDGLVHLTLPVIDVTLGGSAESIKILGAAGVDLPTAIQVDAAKVETWVSPAVTVIVGGTNGVGGTFEKGHLRPGALDGYFTLCRANGSYVWPTGTEIYVPQQTISYQAFP